MNYEEIKKYDKEYNLHSWTAQKDFSPMVVTKADGIYFWDDKGKKYYDMSSQLVNLNIGYGNKNKDAQLISLIFRKNGGRNFVIHPPIFFNNFK